MKVRIGGREVDLNIEQRVGGSMSRHAPVNQGTDSKRPQGRSESEPVAAPSPLYPYKNKLEKAFSVWLDAQWRAGAIKGWLYEPFSFKLAEGKRYRVDFVSWGDEGVVCWETKGWHANIRDSLTHLKWAAQRFPFFKWRKAMRKKGTFEYQDIVV